MVVVCPNEFPEEESYKAEFGTFPSLELSPFQKWSVKAIADGQHSLVTAHTGSGKTLPAEYAIIRAAKRGKRVIYTAPIKALSNTKLSDLRRKYPDISFGLITGDITDNPEAQVLIMTTEVLPNTICNSRARTESPEATHAPLSFQMDFDQELDVVVFDEVHYINDPERGGVWEQAILLLPPTVQLVMLSATIAKAEKFAEWVEASKAEQAHRAGVAPKKLYLSSSHRRVVPLTHHLWLSCSKKALTHPATKDVVAGLNDIPLVVKGPGGCFQERLYARVAKASRHLSEHRMNLRRAGTLNGLLTYLERNNKLPAICFVFSRRQTECCAREVSCRLHGEEDRETVAGIKAECRRILAKRLVNYHEYLALPEYTQLVSMLERGVAVHHAGILPVFREMIEMLFERRMIKVLFATETLAVGVNFSTSSVIFTGLHKFDGTTRRPLYPHEYTQMAGRAGRRGIDKEGHVWICADLCRLDNMRPATCQTIMSGAPPVLSSKFKVGLGMVLSLSTAGAEQRDALLGSTMLGSDLKAQSAVAYAQAEGLEERARKARESAEWLSTPKGVLERCTEIASELKSARKRKRSRLLAELEQLKAEHRTLDRDLQTIAAVEAATQEAERRKEEASVPETVLPGLIAATRRLLATEGFLGDDESSPTTLGMIAQHVREAHPLALAKLLADTDLCGDLTAGQLAAVLSCQSGVSPPNDADGQWAGAVPRSGSEAVDRAARSYVDWLHHFENKERSFGIMSGENYEHSFVMLKSVLAWSEASTEEECKKALALSAAETGIGTGMFVKAMLKICNMASEIAKAGEEIGDLSLKETACAVPGVVLKYIATAQSLYV